MPDFYSPEILTEGQEDIAWSPVNRESTTGEYLGAKFKQGLDFTFGRWLTRDVPLYFATRDQRKMSLDEWKSSPWFRKEIHWNEGMTPGRAEIVAEWYDARRYRDSLVERYHGSHNVLGFGATLAGNALDPINFIPFLKIGTAGARTLGVIAPAVAKREAAVSLLRAAGIGAADTALGTAIVDPFILTSLHSQGEDVGFLDAVADIAFGAAIGGMLGFGGGVLHNAIKGKARRLANMDERANAFKNLEKAVADMEAGEPVRVSMEPDRETMRLVEPSERAPRAVPREARDILIDESPHQAFVDGLVGYVPQELTIGAEHVPQTVDVDIKGLGVKASSDIRLQNDGSISFDEPQLFSRGDVDNSFSVTADAIKIKGESGDFVERAKAAEKVSAPKQTRFTVTNEDINFVQDYDELLESIIEAQHGKYVKKIDVEVPSAPGPEKVLVPLGKVFGDIAASPGERKALVEAFASPDDYAASIDAMTGEAVAHMLNAAPPEFVAGQHIPDFKTTERVPQEMPEMKAVDPATTKTPEQDARDAGVGPDGASPEVDMIERVRAGEEGKGIDFARYDEAVEEIGKLPKYEDGLYIAADCIIRTI